MRLFPLHCPHCHRKIHCHQKLRDASLVAAFSMLATSWLSVIVASVFLVSPMSAVSGDLVLAEKNKKQADHRSSAQPGSSTRGGKDLP